MADKILIGLLVLCGIVVVGLTIFMVIYLSHNSVNCHTNGIIIIGGKVYPQIICE